MRKSSFTFKSNKDSMEIFVNKYECDDDIEIKGVVQISHGMAEHCERYEEFAKLLTDNGYNVYINDHRGHGKTAKNIDNAGYLAEEDGFEYLVDDLHTLTKIIKKENDNLPHILFGHSMGSFASQNYLIKHGDELDGLVLCGSNGDFGLKLKAARIIVKSTTKLKGRRYRSKFIDNLFFGSSNKEFKPNRTNCDWLSRDEKEVDKYIEDPMCGFLCTCGFFQDFVQGLGFIENKNNINKVRKDIPILIISGDKDPVGNNGKGLINLKDRYIKAGVKDVNCILYKDGRHEILNETNKEEVKLDVLNWINEKIETKIQKSF